MTRSDFMAQDLLASLPIAEIEAWMAMPHGIALIAAAFFALTAAIHASGIPGTLLPISFSSGALLGGWLGIVVVAAGAVIGSQVLFALVRRGSQATLQENYGHRLAKLRCIGSKRGIASVAAIRMLGAPHFLVTVLCALAALAPRRYALATAAGLLPAISLSAFAGSFT